MHQAVSQILVREGRAVGIRLQDGAEVLADAVLSNATPKVTFLDLLEEVSSSWSALLSLQCCWCREH